MSARTTRDMERRVFGGVCAGLATRYGYGPARVRVATIALAIVTAGLGGLAYLALWMLLPSAAASPPVASTRDASAPDSATRAAPAAAAPPGAPQLYGPMAADLPRVDEALTAIASDDQPWLSTMLAPMLTGGGKKLRPAIALLAGRLGKYDLDQLVAVAASVELLHTATLVHDDVIDDAPQRRGQPTAAALFGNAASVMLGDYMFAHAADLVAQTGDVRVVRNFARTLRVMASGELQQDLSAFDYSADVQRYLDRIAGKTASLFATAAEGGAIVAAVPEPQVAALRRYGQSLGMAFQIVDDILDFAGDAETMGKAVGSDLREGTLTLPALLYMQDQPDDNSVRLAFDDIDREQNMARAIEEIRDSPAIEESARVARRYGESAREALAAVPEGEARAALDGLIDYVLERRS